VLQFPLFNVSVCWIGFEQLELHADAPDTPAALTDHIKAVEGTEEDRPRLVCSPLQMKGALFDMVNIGSDFTWKALEVASGDHPHTFFALTLIVNDPGLL
jgi:hypothetical protein